MERRAFLAGTAALLTTPLAAEAQQAARVYRIGWLSLGSRTSAMDTLTPFRQSLHQLGYREGPTLLIEARFAEGSADRLRSLAAELVGLKADVLVTESTQAAFAAKRATTSIPIVMLGPGDRSPWASSVASPGRAATSPACPRTTGKSRRSPSRF